MTTLLGVTLFVLALMVAIFLHEGGHFVTAKLFGMKVERFFLGFGRRCGRSAVARPSTASRRCRSAASARSPA
jgi:membrane-associated protease RseP (regulator of RpoE activity)